MNTKSKLISILLVLILVLSVFPVTSFASGASLSGSSSVQAGNSVTLSLNLGTSGAYGFTGTLSYSDNLTFSNYNCSVTGWSLIVNGKNFSAYGTNTCGNNTCVTVTFTVSSSAKAGDSLSASFGSLVASDGNSDISLGTAAWSGSVGAAPSKDCDLSSLSCSNATLSPSFSKGTTNYTTSVEYAVDKLDLSYKTSDVSAKVSVSGNSLVVGSNTVTVTVTAASGAQKVYTIVVTRAQDPNYKPSTDASFSEIYLKIGEDKVALSPSFSPSVYEYIAYVPYETTSVTYGGTPHDEKAIGLTESSLMLSQEGSTDLTITCTAEDGVTKQPYLVHVFRMPKFTGLLPTITFIDPEEEANKIPTIEIPALLTLPLIGQANSVIIAGVILFVLLVLLFVLGLLIGKNASRRRYEEDENYEEEDELPPRLGRAFPVEDVSAKPQPSVSAPYNFEQDTEPSQPDEYAEYDTSAENVKEPDTFSVDSSVFDVSDVEESASPSSSEESISDEERAAEEEVKGMSFDELLDDIRNM